MEVNDLPAWKVNVVSKNAQTEDSKIRDVRTCRDIVMLFAVGCSRYKRIKIISAVFES